MKDDPKQMFEVPAEMLQLANAQMQAMQAFGVGAQPRRSYNVFISHSYADRKHVGPLKQLIESFGLRAYLDWVEDVELDREHVTRATAERLRQRLRQAKCLIFVVSPESAASKWMPWELGFAAGAVGRVGVWSAPDPNAKTFPGQEYLDLYERVTPENLKDFLDRNAADAVPDLANKRAIEEGAVTAERMPQLAVIDPFRAQQEWIAYWTGVWRTLLGQRP
jgi:TIR domain